MNGFGQLICAERKLMANTADSLQKILYLDLIEATGLKAFR